MQAPGKTPRVCSSLGLVHVLLQATLRAGDCCVDATAGNGHDSAFLASLIGAEGELHCFDVQQQALDNTRQRLAQLEHPPQACHLHLTSHEHMATLVQREVAAVVFNLGYLPGSDKSIITSGCSTLAALQAAGGLLRLHGLLLVCCYPGHAGGQAEAQAVQEWFAALPKAHWQCGCYRPLNLSQRAAFVLAAQRTA